MKRNILSLGFVSVLICLCALSTLVLSSCKSNNIDNETTSYFPVNPDKIIVGSDGSVKEILPDDKEYNEIISLIGEHTKNQNGFDMVKLDDHDPTSGNHLSIELRNNETFIEFIYDDRTLQRFDMLQSDGSVSAEELNVNRIFFTLTNDYNNCFFISKDADYKETITIGPLIENTKLIDYVRDLFLQ